MTSNGQNAPLRANPTRGNHAGPASRATGGARSRPRRHSERPRAQRVTSGGTLRIQLSEIKKAVSAHVSGWTCCKSGLSHDAVEREKVSVRSNISFVSRTSAKISRAHMKSHSAFSDQSLTSFVSGNLFVSIVSNASATQKSSAIAEQMTFNSASSCASLRLSVVTVGRSVLHECVPVTFPVLGLHEFAPASR